MDIGINAKKICLLLAAGSCSFYAFAQEKVVTGSVKDIQGEPLIGVSILVKDTRVGTVTDIDGNFKIPDVNPGQTLILSYVGYKTQEVTLRGDLNSPLSIVLKEDAEILDEVVVVGYGTVQKRDLTGSVASVQAEDLAAVPVSSVSEALTGKLSGVSVTTTDGAPDADVNIRVRGGGSLSQDNSPLYIVDGFPVSSISDISPTEIESIDVLKDASSTAIYGARGANGVIIVTTKSGHEGKTQVDFGASFGMKKVAKMMKVLSPYDYVAYQWELDSQDYGNYSDIDIWKSVGGQDFQDDIFGRIGTQQQYNVNVSGGGKDVTYNVSYAHNEEKSIMLNSGFVKDNINAKIKATLNKWMTLDFNARMSYATVDGLSGGADTNESNASNSIVANAARFRPINPLSYDSSDTEDNNTTTQKNPLERLEATYKQKRTLNQNYNVGLNWKPFKNFTFRSEFGYGWKYENIDQAWGADATQYTNLGEKGKPEAVFTNATTRSWRNANTLTYDNKKLFGGRDKINVLVGHEVSSSQKTSLESTSIAFPTSMTVDEILASSGIGTPLANQSAIGAKENMLSFFGRVNYTLMDRYLFTVTVRGDGSSKFAKGNQWGVFPSAAFAWRLSDEKFMKSTQGWLSNLKLRLSLGTAGNNRINSGLIYTTYTLASNTSKAPFFNEVRQSMLELSDNLYNPNLKWETTITRNIGLDYGFFNNRLSGSFDFYWNTTKDLLMRSEIPSNTGFNYQYRNFGKTSNKGVELTLNAVLVEKRNFGLNFNLNLAYNRNRIDELATDNPWQNSNWAGSIISKYEDFRIEQGGSLGEIWGYKANGFYTVYDPVMNPAGELILNGTTWVLKDGVKDNSATLTGGQYYPGGLKLVCDENGNPVKQKLGNTIAPLTGGFGLDGYVGNFDFNVFLNYSVGNQIVNGTKLATSFYAGSSKGYNLNGDFALANRYTWIDPSTGLNLGKLSTGTLESYGGELGVIARLNEINSNASIYNPAAVTLMQLNDYAVEDASFLRLNNVTLGYTLPKSWTKKCFMQKVRFYVTGYNLFVFTKYSGSDPEVDTSSKKNAMTPGIDYASYPKSRTFVGGVNVTF